MCSPPIKNPIRFAELADAFGVERAQAEVPLWNSTLSRFDAIDNPLRCSHKPNTKRQIRSSRPRPIHRFTIAVEVRPALKMSGVQSGSRHNERSWSWRFQ